MIRLTPNHAARIVRAPTLDFTFEGQALTAHEGDTIAVALWRAGVLRLRDAPVDAAPRGMFCCMGLCQECVVLVDGRVVEACRQRVTPDLAVCRVRGTV